MNIEYSLCREKGWKSEMLRVEFQIITPLVLSGADQGGAELRLPSVKGMLRYWYRALDPEYNQKNKDWKERERGRTYMGKPFIRRNRERRGTIPFSDETSF
ncbi:MAG: type III-B CRISPR module RAMP protein Cmr1 [Thermoactinomycetaceae bacterium]|nr:type III-B CRISPR module RAMP protein Cmr1 [Thermoactinomycetaceae bacterium]